MTNFKAMDLDYSLWCYCFLLKKKTKQKINWWILQLVFIIFLNYFLY